MFLWLLFIFVFALSWFITLFIRRWAIYKRILDKPNIRSAHKKITPLGGGIAIVTCWYIVIFVLYFFRPELMPPHLLYALLPGILVLIIGMRDDVKPISPWIRIVCQAIIVEVSIYLLGGGGEGLGGIGVDKLDFGFLVFHSPIITNTFFFLVFLWFINLFNFYDGLDGNLGAETIAICLMSLILVPLNPLIFLIACTGGFLVWNWQKAKIFMGDAGSTFLGFNFAVFGLYFQNEYEIPFILWLLICGIAIFDTSYTLIRRIIYKENVFLPHKNQIFHRLVLSGFSHQQVVFIQQGLNVAICLGVWYALKDRTAIVPVIIGIALLLGGYAFWAEKRFPYDKGKKKKKQ